MKSQTLLSALGALVLLAGCGREAEQVRQSQQKELEAVRAELEEIKTERANLQTEVTRLRKDNEDLLRLRNEVRQLRDAQKQLSQQAQSAQAEAKRAQAQVQSAQEQALAQRRAREQELLQAQAQAAQAAAQSLGTNAPQTLTPEQQAFAARYGLNPQTVGQQSNCINNLRQIVGAKQQWALENRKAVEAVPTAQDLAAYLKDGVLPKCPGGGAYTLNAVGAYTTCSIAGHALP